MVREDTIAQASAAPSNGASNARDFQPETRNPQTGPLNTQPQSGGIQETGSQQILDNPNTVIEVPVSPADPSAAALAEAARGINWPGVIIITVLIVIIAEWLIRKRERRSVTTPVIEPAEPVIESDSSVASVVLPEETEVTEESKPQDEEKAFTQGRKKKKSKNKRKNK